MWLTYSFLLTWVGGGLTLLAMLALRTTRRPYALALAALGYGATGFVSAGLGLEPKLMQMLAAVGGALVAGAIGYGISMLARPTKGLPVELR